MAAYNIDKNPADELSLKNRAAVRDKTNNYAKVTVPGVLHECYLTLSTHPKMAAGRLGLSGIQVSCSRICHHQASLSLLERVAECASQ